MQGGEEVVAELARLNEAYEAKFPGLRFVVFVNGRGRGEIMGIMNERIEKVTEAMRLLEKEDLFL